MRAKCTRKTQIYSHNILTIEVADLSLHLGEHLDALGGKLLEASTSRIDSRTQFLGVHAVTVVKVGRDLLSLGRREGAGAHGVAPASVADGGTDEVQLGAERVGVDLLDEHGDVDARIGLTSDVELVALVLRESSEEVHEELVGILSGGLVGVNTLGSLGSTLAVGESNTLGGLQVNNVGEAAPAVGVKEHLGHTINLVGQGIIIGDNLSVLSEQADQRRGSGSTVKPQDNGVGGWVVGGLNQPVVELTLHARKVASGDV